MSRGRVAAAACASACAALLGLLAAEVGAATGVTPAAKLLLRHAPVLVLHPDDPFVPVPVEGFLADSDVTALAPDGTWQVVPGPLPVGGAQTRLDQRLCRAIDGPAALACYADAEAAHGAAATVYGAVFRRGSGVALLYWLFYPYDVWSQTGPGGTVWRAHEGDWESVTVLLDARERPVTVALSRHCSGVRRTWQRARRATTHPLVYVSLGSHANQLGPGTRRQEVACWPELGQTVLEALRIVPVDVAAEGRRVRPTVVAVSATTPSWMRYAGRWGEAQYAGLAAVDPITFGTGPEGPALHDAWRRPFAEPLSWPSG